MDATPFNLYDFIGYLMPGAFVLALVYWLLVGFLGLPLPLSLDSVGESIVFLVAAYFAGHLIQMLGKRIERGKIEQWGGWFSERFLDDDDNFYSPEFKARIRALAQQVFHLTPASPGSPASRQQTREIFNLCYSLVMQEGIGAQTEVFNATYSLYRGMLAGMRVAVGVGALVGVKHLALYLLGWRGVPLPTVPFYAYSDLHLALAVLMLALAAVAIPRLAHQWKVFSQHFANSIYRGFYVWCIRRAITPATTDLPAEGAALIEHRESASG